MPNSKASASKLREQISGVDSFESIQTVVWWWHS